MALLARLEAGKHMLSHRSAGASAGTSGVRCCACRLVLLLFVIRSAFCCIMLSFPGLSSFGCPTTHLLTTFVPWAAYLVSFALTALLSFEFLIGSLRCGVLIAAAAASMRQRRALLRLRDGCRRVYRLPGPQRLEGASVFRRGS